MGFALLSRQDDGHPLSVWSQLADIEEVEGQLGHHDRAFLRALGTWLADRGSAVRFGVTLLHSHFSVSQDEALVEGVTEDGRLVTEVLPLHAAETDRNIVPRSWMFADRCAADGSEEISVLTWCRRDHLPQAPLGAGDEGLVAGMARLHRDWEVTGRFGMTLAGPAPGTGMIWTEDNDADSRHLLQAAKGLEEAQSRSAVVTMYTFSRDGLVIPTGCCVSGVHGHTGARQTWGRRY